MKEYTLGSVIAFGSEYLPHYPRQNRPSSTSSIHIACAWPERTPFWLEVDGIEATLYHPVADVLSCSKFRPAVPSLSTERRGTTHMQTGKCFGDVQRGAGRLFAAPENLRRRRSTRPDDGVQILRTRLLAPQNLFTCQWGSVNSPPRSRCRFTSENESVLELSQVCQRIKGIRLKRIVRCAYFGRSRVLPQTRS